MRRALFVFRLLVDLLGAVRVLLTAAATGPEAAPPPGAEANERAPATGPVRDAPADPAGDEEEDDLDRRELQSPHVVLDRSAESKAAATQAALAHVLARPDSIRQRAQNAATISSAVAVAVVVAAVTQLGNQEETWRPWTIALVLTALVLWTITVWRFVHVVTFGTSKHPRQPSYQALVNSYERYSEELRRRLRAAAWFSAAALAVTAAAVVSEVLERAYAQGRERQLVLSSSGMTAVASLCGWERRDGDGTRRINARVSSDELSQRMVELDVLSRPVPPGTDLEQTCREAREMRLPRGAIRAAADLEP